MTGFSYNLTPEIKKALEKIDSLRIKILTFPLTPKEELELRFDALIERICYAQKFENLTFFDKPEIKRILINNPTNKLKRPEQVFILKYQTAFYFLNREMLGTKNNLNIKTTKDLVNVMLKTNLSSEFDNLLHFLNSASDHPCLLSACIFIGFLLQNQQKNSDTIACLLAYSYLYRFAFDFRGLFVLENVLCSDLKTYREKISQAKNAITWTNWIEFYLNMQVLSLEKTWEKINLLSSEGKVGPEINLNDRQKQILDLLDNPARSITNRKVQSLFKISQITASRDLSNLTNYGLLYPHGKGRSVYYTKA